MTRRKWEPFDHEERRPYFCISTHRYLTNLAAKTGDNNAKAYGGLLIMLLNPPAVDTS